MLLKIGAWALGGGLLLMGLGIVAFNTLAQDWVQQELVPQVEAGLSRSLGYPVVLGPVQNLSPWGVQLGPSRVEGLGKVAEVNVGFTPTDLLQQPIPLTLTLKAPQVDLIQRQNLSWKITDLFQNLQAPSANQPVQVKQVTFQQGMITVLPHQSPPFTLTDLAGTVTIPANGTTTFNGQGALAKAPWNVTGWIKEGRTKISLTLNQVPVAKPFALLNLGTTFAVTGDASGAVQLAWEQNPIPDWEGQLRLTKGTARVGGLAQPIDRVNTLLIFRGRDIQTSELKARFGLLDLTGQGKLVALRDLDLGIRGEQLSLIQLQKTFAIQLPVPVNGLVRVQAGLRGALDNLVLAGTFKERAKGTVDRIPLDRYQGDFRVAVRERNLNFSKLQIQALGGQVQGQGRVDLNQGQLAFTGNAQDLNAQPVWRVYGGSKDQTLGRLGGNFQVSGPASALKTQIAWILKGGDWPGQGQLTALGSRYEIRDAVFTKFGGQIKAQAVLNQQSWTARLIPVGLQVDQLLQRPGLKAPLDGDLTLRGQWGNFQLSAIRGEGTLRLPQGIGPLTTAVQNQFTWNGNTALLTARPQAVQVTGPVTITDDLQIPRWDLNVVVQRQALPPRLFPVPVVGQVSGTGQLTGNPDQPRFVGQARLERLKILQIKFPVLQGPVQWQPQQASLDLSGTQSRLEVVLVNNQPQRLAIRQGITSLTGNRVGNTLVGTVANLPLELVPSLTDLELPLGWIGGQVGGDYRLALAGPPLFSSTLTLQQGRFGNLRLDQAQGAVLYQNNRWQVSGGEVVLDGSRYQINGSWDLARDYIDAQFATQNGRLEALAEAFGVGSLADLPRIFGEGLVPRNLGTARQIGTVQQAVVGTLWERILAFEKFLATYTQRLSPRQREDRRPSGQIQGQVNLTGPRSNLAVVFDVQAQRGRIGNIPFQRANAKGRFQDQTLVFENLFLRLPGAVERTGTFRGQFSPDQQTGTLEVSNFPVGATQGLFPANLRIRGDLSLTVALRGKPSDPGFRGNFRISNARLNRAPLRQAEGGIGYREGRLTLFDVLIATGDEPARINGSFPLPILGAVPKDNRVRMQLAVQDEALKLVNLFTDQVQWQGGTGALDLQIGGRTTELDLQGTLFAKQGTLALAGFAKPVTDVALTVTFLGDRARVEELTGNLSGGRIRADPGELALVNDRGLAPLPVALDALKLKLPDLYEGEAAGQLLIGGSILSPTFGGRVVLKDGRFSLPSTDKKAPDLSPSLTPVLDDQSLESASIQRIASPNLNLQVVLGERLTLEQAPVLRVETQGELTLRGTLARIQPEGTIRLGRGRLNLFTAVFYLDNSRANTARFRRNLGLDPELDILAVARATEVNFFGTPSAIDNTKTLNNNPSAFGSQQTVRINALVTGRASKPNIELRSSPPRSRDEIIALLGGDATQSLISTGASIVTSPILSPLENFFSDNLGLDEFRISPVTRTDPGNRGAIGFGLGLEVAKDLTQQLSVSISQNLTDPNQPTRLNVRYRISETVQLRVGTDFDRDVSFSIEYETRF